MPIEEILKLQKGAQYELWMRYLEFWIEAIALTLIVLLILSPFFILYRHHKSMQAKEGKKQCQQQKEPLNSPGFRQARR